jgi:hypothetical protein
MWAMLATILFRVCLPVFSLKTWRLNYKTIILHVVLYEHETWSLTLREEHRLRVFENRMLKRIFGPRKEEVAGCWRRLHSEELHNFYASPNIRVIKSRRIQVRHVTCMGKMRNA